MNRYREVLCGGDSGTHTQAGMLPPGTRLAVLVNGATRSSAEILAGAFMARAEAGQVMLARLMPAASYEKLTRPHSPSDVTSPVFMCHVCAKGVWWGKGWWWGLLAELCYCSSAVEN